MNNEKQNGSRLWLINGTLGLVIAIVIGLITGCNRPNPTPELTDPIYSDLLQRSAVAKAAAESKKAEIKTLRTDLSNLPARDTSRNKMLEDVTSKEHLLMAAEQEALYYEIRATQRKEYARDEYAKAFGKNQPWPDPADFVAYKLQKKLKDSPREWGSKIQKTDRYNRKSQADTRKEIDEKQKKTESGGTAGSHK